jgi:hypothetical protein
MGETSIDVAGSVHGLVSGITALSDRLRGVIFNIVSARLQVEMLLTFVHELISSEATADASDNRRGLIKTLHDAFSGTMGQASVALHDLESTVHPLSAMADDLERFMLSLQVAQVSALVESARISNQGDFLDIFVSIKEQIDQTHDELAELSDALHRLDRLAHDTPTVAREIKATVDRIDQDICALPTDSVVPRRGVRPPPRPLGTRRQNLPVLAPRRPVPILLRTATPPLPDHRRPLRGDEPAGGFSVRPIFLRQPPQIHRKAAHLVSLSRRTDAFTGAPMERPPAASLSSPAPSSARTLAGSPARSVRSSPVAPALTPHPLRMKPLPSTRWLAGGAAVVAAALGILTLVAWALGHRGLSAVDTSYISMAPITASLFVVLGLATLGRTGWPGARFGRPATTVGASLAALAGFLELARLVRKFPLPWDTWGFATEVQFGDLGIGQMSPRHGDLLRLGSGGAPGSRERLGPLGSLALDRRDLRRLGPRGQRVGRAQLHARHTALLRWRHRADGLAHGTRIHRPPYEPAPLRPAPRAAGRRCLPWIRPRPSLTSNASSRGG